MILVQAADVTDGGGGFGEHATGHRRTRLLANAFGVRGISGRVLCCHVVCRVWKALAAMPFILPQQCCANFCLEAWSPTLAMTPY